MDTGTRVLLASRPVGEPAENNFRIEPMPVPAPGPGEMLLRTLWLSLDPYMRGRMSDAPSYAAPVEIGEVMEGRTVSEVVESNLDGYPPGDIVLSPSGWQTYAISQGKLTRKIDPSIAPISTALGVLGMPGMTAYTGLSRSASRRPARRSWCRRHPVRSARSSARSPGSRALAPSASPAGRTNAATSSTNSASTPASTIARPTWRTG